MSEIDPTESGADALSHRESVELPKEPYTVAPEEFDDWFAKVVRVFQPRLLSTVRNWLNSRDFHAAEDVVQESLLALSAFALSGRQITSLRGLLFEMARLRVRQEVRNTSRLRASLSENLDSVLSDTVEPAVPVAESELEQAIREGLAQISDRHREYIIAFYFLGLGYKETAVALNVSIGTVSSQLYVAKDLLLRKIGPQKCQNLLGSEFE